MSDPYTPFEARLVKFIAELNEDTAHFWDEDESRPYTEYDRLRDEAMFRRLRWLRSITGPS